MLGRHLLRHHDSSLVGVDCASHKLGEIPLTLIGLWRLSSRALLLANRGVTCDLGSLRIHFVVVSVHFEDLLEFKVVFGPTFGAIFRDGLRPASIQVGARLGSRNLKSDLLRALVLQVQIGGYVTDVVVKSA